MFKIGIVTHYFDKVGMAFVRLEGTLAVGDKVKFVFNHEDLFTQTIEVIQIEHRKVDSAMRGDMIALKTNDAVSKGTEIFKAGSLG